MRVRVMTTSYPMVSNLEKRGFRQSGHRVLMITDRPSRSSRCTALRLHDVGPHLKGLNLTATVTFSPFSFLPGLGFLEEDLRGAIGTDADTPPLSDEP